MLVVNAGSLRVVLAVKQRHRSCQLHTAKSRDEKACSLFSSVHGLVLYCSVRLTHGHMVAHSRGHGYACLKNLALRES